MQFFRKTSILGHQFPDFILLTMLGNKININIDLEWIKNGFENVI